MTTSSSAATNASSPPRIRLKTVPVIFVDLSPEQSHLLNLALNKISGDWDEQLLARMLADLQEQAVDLAVSGFGADEINALLKGLEASDNGIAWTPSIWTPRSPMPRP